jgi:UDP-GlcNAc:undecaprenyl-phosphate GlcNAc-1-phosphate transferase
MQILIEDWKLYAAAILLSFFIAFLITPIVRITAIVFGWLDAPSSSIKTHTMPTPAIGGVAIYISYVVTLLLMRFWTRFPTGTLHNLRVLIIGGTIVFAGGIFDDLKKPKGLDYRLKFLIEFAAAAVLMFGGLRIRFIYPTYLAGILTLIWIVGITNAFNIIDIMDGLSASQAAIAAMGFLVISLPSEALYVNFASAALIGAAIGFLPWNFSKKRKIFMGDSGSLLLGFLLAGVSLGTRYSDVNPAGVYAPLLILLVPIYDTLFVMVLRLMKGKSPFLGSKDHFALRLEKMGYSRAQVVLIAACMAGFLGFCAFLATQLSLPWAIFLYVAILVPILMLSRALTRVVIYD